VRFTDDELDKMIPISTEIVQGFVQSTNSYFIFKRFGVKEGDW